jgi:hypothetical protein
METFDPDEHGIGPVALSEGEPLSPEEMQQQENERRLNALAAEGVAPNPLDLLKMRLDLVTTSFIGGISQLAGIEPEVLQTQIDTAWERMYAEHLDDLEAAVRRAKLTAGGHTQLSIADLKL